MYLHEFLLYMIVIIGIVYGVMFCIEWMVKKKHQIFQTTLSTGIIYLALIGIGTMYQFHVVILYALCASAIIVLNKYWFGCFSTE